MAAVRATKQVLNVTENAASRIKTLLQARNPSPYGVRIGVRKRGCNGLSYTLNYADEKSKGDEMVSQHGVNILVEPKAIFHIVGTTMDYHEDDMGSEFRFRNPNEKARCGCGESFTTSAHEHVPTAAKGSKR